MESKTIYRELHAAIEGEVLFDELSRTIYSCAASLYRIKPLAIVKPRHKKDVVTVVKYAAQRGIPITPRGGGTSRAGNEVGKGILLDFTKYMNHILEFSAEEKWVRIQPGLILAVLNKFLKPHHLFFPIDPSTKDHCTLGGMIANNSSGPHAVKYGATRDYVLSLEVILSKKRTLISPWQLGKGCSKRLGNLKQMRSQPVMELAGCKSIKEPTETPFPLFHFLPWRKRKDPNPPFPIDTLFPIKYTSIKTKAKP